MSNNADGKHVVVENGQRASVTMDKAAADLEAAKRKQLHEKSGQKQSEGKVEVKQNIYG